MLQQEIRVPSTNSITEVYVDFSLILHSFMIWNIIIEIARPHSAIAAMESKPKTSLMKP